MAGSLSTVGYAFVGAEVRTAAAVSAPALAPAGLALAAAGTDSRRRS
jgi:hypothetical protein